MTTLVPREHGASKDPLEEKEYRERAIASTQMRGLQCRGSYRNRGDPFFFFFFGHAAQHAGS